MIQGMLFDISETASSDMLVVKTKTAKQLAKICKVQETLSDCFGEIEQGYDYSYSSGALWSMHDLIEYILEQIGPAHLFCSTWSVSDPATNKMLRMIDRGMFLGINMLVDWRVQVRTPGFFTVAKQHFANIAVTSCHAKVFVLKNKDWTVSVIGSANLTNNPRIEAGHMSTSKEIAEFHIKWISAEISKNAPFGTDMRKVGKKDGRK